MSDATTPAMRPDELLRAREATVIAHVAAERRRDFDAALATFSTPRYELPGDEVVEGPDAVADMLRELFGAFPDLVIPDVDPAELAHSGDSVMGVSRMIATHAGSYRGARLPAPRRTNAARTDEGIIMIETSTPATMRDLASQWDTTVASALPADQMSTTRNAERVVPPAVSLSLMHRPEDESGATRCSQTFTRRSA